jgi:asparagine synthase (glutamine-hydrolysing)
VEFFQLPYRKRIEYLLKVRQDSSFTLRKFLVYIGLFANSEIRINRIKSVHAGLYNQWKSKSDHSIWQQESSAYHSFIELHKNEVFKTHLPQLLRYEDRNAAAFGIEGRQPFLDNNLSEFILKLPLENKLNKGESKYILRKALQKNGFDQLSKQKIKIGFTASDLIWKDAKGEMFDLIKESRILKHLYFSLPNFENNSRLMWKLQSIARWEKMYNL